MSWILGHWEWVLLVFWLLEKLVKLSPTKKDDIIFDMILKPIIGYLKSALGKK